MQAMKHDFSEPLLLWNILTTYYFMVAALTVNYVCKICYKDIFYSEVVYVHLNLDICKGYYEENVKETKLVLC